MRKFMMAALLAMAVVGCKTESPEHNAVGITAIDEPDAVPSNQAMFASEHPDESACATPNEMESRLKSKGYVLANDDGPKQTWISKTNEIELDVSPMEVCIV